ERTRLIRAAREVNASKPKFVVSQIRERAERFKRPVIACLGLTYKPDVDDLRDSPAIEIAKQLACTGEEQILIADPNLRALPEELTALSNISFCDTLEAVRHADIVALLVAHSRFRKIPPEELMRRVVIDVTGLTHGDGKLRGAMKLLFVFGTRPEAIKLAPVVRELSARPTFQCKVCVTGQHRELLAQVLDLFGLRPDWNLEIMRPDQDLAYLTGAALSGVSGILASWRPDRVIV